MPLGVVKCYHNAVRSMLKKQEQMWSGELGEISMTEYRVDLISNARPFQSPQYRAGPKTREREKLEVQKHINIGVIEPTISEWAASVLFAPKMDGKLRCCV